LSHTAPDDQSVSKNDKAMNTELKLLFLFVEDFIRASQQNNTLI